MVMGRVSCSKGGGFDFRRRVLDRNDTFLKLICCKNCIVCLKRLKIKIEAGVGPFVFFKDNIN